MKINVFIQARMTSSRLPGKVLENILNKPMLLHIIERLKYTTTIDKIVVLTSDQISDDAIEEFCTNYQIHCFRGPLDDVLQRFYLASIAYPSDHIVRITADCPLVDSALVDKIVNLHLCKKADFTSNCHPATFPDGLDVEIMKTSALRTAHHEAKTAYQREHVTPYLFTQPDTLTCANFEANELIPDYRLTVDHPQDLQLIKNIYESLYKTEPNFDLSSTLKLLYKHPQWLKQNEHFERNEALKNNAVGDK
ncbi:glycosyltransferase family protein [Pseudoalteromonas holothuriae]|nr:glycosyltransferase family protein [Pseudoalteromonas sp. CIP111854]